MKDKQDHIGTSLLTNTNPGLSVNQQYQNLSIKNCRFCAKYFVGKCSNSVIDRFAGDFVILIELKIYHKKGLKQDPHWYHLVLGQLDLMTISKNVG